LTAKLTARIAELRETEEGVIEVVLEMGGMEVVPRIETLREAGELAIALVAGRDAFEESPG
jgi:hypothetical protein